MEASSRSSRWGCMVRRCSITPSTTRCHNLEKVEFFLPDIMGDMVQEGKARVRVLTSDAQWFGVTYKEDRPRVEQAIRALIEQGVYPENLWQ